MTVAWYALAASGLAFWFLIGFPFGHHNESYVWIERLSTPDLPRVMGYHFQGAAGDRPIAMALAWAMFQLGRGSLVPIQLLNFAVTILAWWVLVRASGARKTFALAALAAGGLLFSGYIYLFHLHGVFYGPMLLWLAAAVLVTEGELTPRRLGVLFLAGMVVALVHTYTLVLCLALLAGTTLERGWHVSRGVRIFALVGVLVCVALVLATAPGGLLDVSLGGLVGLVTSFRAVEVNRIVAAACAAFALATVATTRWPGGARVQGIALVTTVVGLLVLARGGAPLAFAWLAAGGIKAGLHRRWTLAALLAATLGLPFAGASGSPTYVVFTIALLVYLVAVDTDDVERRLTWLRPSHALAASALVLALAFVVRGELEVPGVSALARPVLAEKERTHQGERILRDILASEHRLRPVRLAADAGLPAESGGAVDRRQRAPTQQACLDEYLEYARGAADSTAAPIILSFGVAPAPGAAPLWAVPGRHAGPAVAVLDEP